MTRPYHKKRQFFLLFILLTTALAVSTSPLAEAGSIEYKIKAGYLYNFTKFISWPEDSVSTFNLCILGEDPFGAIIDPIEKRKVKDKPIRLFRFKTISQISHCHILYIDGDESNWNATDLPLSGTLVVSSLEGTLLVGESKKFIVKGGNIAFFVRKGKIKLHINLQSLRTNNLEVSAKLLEIAEVYEGEGND